MHLCILGLIFLQRLSVDNELFLKKVRQESDVIKRKRLLKEKAKLCFTAEDPFLFHILREFSHEAKDISLEIFSSLALSSPSFMEQWYQDTLQPPLKPFALDLLFLDRIFDEKGLESLKERIITHLEEGKRNREILFYTPLVTMANVAEKMASEDGEKALKIFSHPALVSKYGFLGLLKGRLRDREYLKAVMGKDWSDYWAYAFASLFSRHTSENPLTDEEAEGLEYLSKYADWSEVSETAPETILLGYLRFGMKIPDALRENFGEDKMIELCLTERSSELFHYSLDTIKEQKPRRNWPQMFVLIFGQQPLAYCEKSAKKLRKVQDRFFGHVSA